jgi:hypothetical protein
MKRPGVLIIVMLAFCASIFAQNNELQLARQYAANGEQQQRNLLSAIS